MGWLCIVRATVYIYGWGTHVSCAMVRRGRTGNTTKLKFYIQPDGTGRTHTDIFKAEMSLGIYSSPEKGAIACAVGSSRSVKC